MHMKIVKADGSNLGADSNVSVVNNTLSSLIKSCDMYINGHKVTQDNTAYAYIAFLENFCTDYETKLGTKNIIYGSENIN